MEKKRYYWLKLKDDFFHTKAIKKLRRQGNGYLLTLIYLKMQLRSLRSGGLLYFDGYETDFAAELALDLDEDEDAVRETIRFLEAQHLLEPQEQNAFLLTVVPDVTGTESESAERVRRHRERKALQCNEDVTPCNTEKEKEKREKREESESEAASPPAVLAMQKPTLAEVRAYCRERHYHTDPLRFYEYYEKSGWYCGNTPMKSWRSVLDGWEKEDAPQHPPKPHEEPWDMADEYLALANRFSV